MAKDKYDYDKGDWLVHHYYGLGQVVGRENKRINGRQQLFYKVKTKDSLFWVPVDNADCDRVRPLASKKEVNSAIQILKKTPKKISQDHKLRKKKIHAVREEGSLTLMAQLVRDLSARQFEHRLNTTEQTALQRFTERLLAEWSTRMGLKPKQARRKLYEILSDHFAAEKDEPDQDPKGKNKRTKALSWLQGR